LSRLVASVPARKLAVLLSLLMVLLGGPAGDTFALCLGGDGHLAIEAVQTGGHDHGAVPGIVADHSAVSADCVDVSLVQAAPAITKKQIFSGFDIALSAASPAWGEQPTAEASHTALPTAEPPLDPRLVSHRTVVLLN
jgi:hypothetical protein